MKKKHQQEPGISINYPCKFQLKDTIMKSTKYPLTEGERQLILRDLASRIQYNVKFQCDGQDDTLIAIDMLDTTNSWSFIWGEFNSYSSENVRPYLFPISSMTKEQQSDLIKRGLIINFKGFDDIQSTVTDIVKWINWLNKNHFDYRGLIDKGLAIDATNLNIY